MDKKYMLQAVQNRIGVLEELYVRSLSSNTNSVKVKRHNVKRDLCVLLLIEQLLFRLDDDTMIDDADALLGLEKLCRL